MASDRARRAGLAVLAGAAWALAHPPFGLWPASFVVLGLLLAAVHGLEDRRAFAALLGAVTGLVAFVVILAWTRNIRPGGAVAWPLLALVQAAWVAAYAILARRWTGRRGGVVALPLLFVGVEALRGSVPLGGFGWGEFAYAHAGVSWLSPMARLVGGRGITLAVAAVGVLLFEAWRRQHDALMGLSGPRLDRAAAALPHMQPALLGLAAVLAVTVLATIEPPAAVASADVLVVQGNDRERWDLPGRAVDLAVARNHLELTTQAYAADGPADLVVWPESSVDDDPARRDDLAEVLRQGGALTSGRLVAGVKLDGPRPRTFYNTLQHVAETGVTDQTYVKRHLVPFGEFVPWRSLLDWVPPLRAVPNDGIPGDGPAPVDVGPIRIASAICFETLFPDLVRDNVLDGDRPAQLVVAITNDASFGRGAQTAQHLAQSRLRAVETGRWIVHAAVSGASAFVDPDGGLHDVTPVFAATTIRREVGLVDGRTPFLVIGDVVGRLGILAVIVELLRRTVRARRRPRSAS